MTTFLTGKMSGKDVEGKFRERTPGKQKTWPEAQPEAPANSFKNPVQNSKQQRSRRKRRSPQKWGWASGQVFSWPGVFDISLRFLRSVKKLSKATKIFLAKSIFPQKRLLAEDIIEKTTSWRRHH